MCRPFPASPTNGMCTMGSRAQHSSMSSLNSRYPAHKRQPGSTARHRFRDFDLSVTAIARQGPIDNAFGVVFQVQDREDGACDLPAVILCGVDRLLPLAGAAIRQVLHVTKANGYFAFLISSGRLLFALEDRSR